MITVQDAFYNADGTKDFRLESDSVEELNKLHDRLLSLNVFTHVEEYRNVDDEKTSYACMEITHDAMSVILTNFANMSNEEVV